MKQLQLLGLALLMMLASCLNNIDDVSSTQQTPNPEILDNYVQAVRNITGSLTGFVVDDSNDPVIGAEVRMGSLTTTTDDYGHFFFEDVTMNALGQLVRVEETGYFDGSRRFFPIDGAMSRVKIELLPKVFDKSFNAQSGGTINVTGGGSLEFNTDAIKDANGDTYTGEVKLATQWLDPTSLNTFDQMPGNLQGVNTRNAEMALATYGMMAVELQSPTGESLNLLDGETAKISMPVPAEILGNAPAEIPLWSYSETHGVWVEEGLATLVGNEYIGEVGHFSFWNCDIPRDYVFFETQITDAAGNPLANYMVVIESATSGAGYGYTDMQGNVSGIIPANEVLTISIYSNICHELLHSESMGPFAVDATYGPIAVSGENILTTVVSGQLVDCDMNPITDGLVIVTYNGNNHYEYLEEADFEIEITTCESTTEVTVVGIDMDEFIQSQVFTAPANEATDLGAVEICDNPLSDYILLTIDGNTALYNGVFSDTTGYYTYLSVSQSNPLGEDYLGFGFGGNEAGDYSNNNFIEYISNQEFGWQFQGGSFSNLIVTTFEQTPDVHIVGTIDGTMESNGSTYSVSGSFEVIR
ncbi:MAG: carboxypeptidase regulatory-like domain-containing protein [Bacteroidetes bacterium]|nr:carboxypeptidase regulatory-like domain-containing protein [Bacteroidota bacterium]